MVWGWVGGEALVVSVRLKEELKPRKGIQINRSLGEKKEIPLNIRYHFTVMSLAQLSGYILTYLVQSAHWIVSISLLYSKESSLWCPVPVFFSRLSYLLYNCLMVGHNFLELAVHPNTIRYN